MKNAIRRLAILLVSFGAIALWCAVAYEHLNRVSVSGLNGARLFNTLQWLAGTLATATVVVNYVKRRNVLATLQVLLFCGLLFFRTFICLPLALNFYADQQRMEMRKKSFDARRDSPDGLRRNAVESEATETRSVGSDK